MHFIRSTFFSLLCFCSASSYAQSLYEIDSVISNIAAANAKLYTGLAIGIVQQKQIIYHKGFGVIDRKERTLCTDTSIMEVASISKAIVGMAIAKAIEMGFCHLDSPVNSMLPFNVVNPHAASKFITLRQVVTHTSGIHDTPGFFWKTFQYTDFEDPDVLLYDFVFAFLNPAGRYYNKRGFHKSGINGYPVDYSNLNAALGALMVEHVTKMKFSNFTQKYIFNKAGMSKTGWFFSQLVNKTPAQKYTSNKLRLRHYTIRSYPSSTLFTSVADMNNLLLSVANAVSNNVFDNPTTLSILFDDVSHKYDYGIFWKRYGKHYGCTGVNLGIEALLRFNPASGSGYIIIFNQTLKGKQKKIYTELERYVDKLTQ
ncbi:MAG: serine hydrolase [Bacteroidota bacterium]|nr:serine hydrolase [Bacteroidota bacterium]